eukprot:1376757-Rhodomonas_salina.1
MLLVCPVLWRQAFEGMGERSEGSVASTKSKVRESALALPRALDHTRRVAEPGDVGGVASTIWVRAAVLMGTAMRPASTATPLISMPTPLGCESFGKNRRLMKTCVLPELGPEVGRYESSWTSTVT